MKIFLCVLSCVCASLLQAQSAVQYFISFPNRVHHEAEVQVTFSDLPHQVLEVRMSRSSPGRYALHEFAKNVYNFKATDGHGNALTPTRPNPHQWNISSHDGTVQVHYTIFGDRADGTYLAVDDTHAHINMPATFMWARGLQKRPIEITFELTEQDWKVATQLAPTETANKFTAPNLDYFMDSPTELSAFDSYTWEVNSAGVQEQFTLAIHHEGTDAEANVYAHLCSLVVEEEKAVFAELAPFDYGHYTFIADYLPYVNGDGMEHRNSTICISNRALADQAVRNLGTISHEFFHSWNVERIRPRSLEPFNFERANMSGELWFAEGFTSYYDGLILKRANITSIDRYAEDLTRILNPFLHMPGRQFASPVEMSRQAPFVDAGVSIDSKNLSNTFISYYTYGSAIGLALDLTLRQEFPATTLDDFMRKMWGKYGRTEQPYTNDDLKTTLGEVTGDTAFADDFFRKYIYGRELPAYATLIQQGGFQLRKAHAGQAWFGLPKYKIENEKIGLLNPTLIGSPLYKAGLDRDDAILKIDSLTFSDKEALKHFLEGKKPGEIVQILFEANDKEQTTQVTLAENPELEVVPFEHLNRTLSPEVLAFRQNWLDSHAGAERSTLHRFCPVCQRSWPFRFEYCRYDGEKLLLTRKNFEE